MHFLKFHRQALSKSSGEAESQKRAETKSLGFTLIELLTSIAVIGIVSAVIFTRVGTSKQNLNRAAQRLALDIRRVQNLALAPNTTPPAPCLYGLRVINGTTYSIYRRANCSNGSQGHRYNAASSNNIETINISSLYNGVSISTTNNRDIAFEAPEPITYAYGNSNNSTTITLTCGAACGSKTVTVNRFGMVEIQ